MAWVLFCYTKPSSLRSCFWLRQCELSPTQLCTSLEPGSLLQVSGAGGAQAMLASQAALVPVSKVTTRLERSKQTSSCKWIKLEAWN